MTVKFSSVAIEWKSLLTFPQTERAERWHTDRQAGRPASRQTGRVLRSFESSAEQRLMCETGPRQRSAVGEALGLREKKKERRKSIINLLTADSRSSLQMRGDGSKLFRTCFGVSVCLCVRFKAGPRCECNTARRRI